VDPVPDPLLLRKSGSAGNRTRDLCICSQKLWPLDHRGGPSSETSALITIVTWQVYTNVIVTIQWLFLETASYGNFKTISQVFITGRSSVSAKQNIQHVYRFHKNLVLKIVRPHFLVQPPKFHLLLLLLLLLNLAVQNRLAQVAV